MKNRIPMFLLAAPLLLLIACGKNGASDAAESGEHVATVNGKVISSAEFDIYLDNVGRQSGREMTDEQKSQLLDQYISMKLAAEVAEQAGITKDPVVNNQIALARMNVIVDAALQKYIDDHPVGEEELKPEYDAQIAAMPREYHARHILVEDQAAAEAITRQLEGGADFAALAAQKSKDPSSHSGGDLGWFTLDSMVKPFSDAVAMLQPGQITRQPVESQFGWHIIQLEGSRAATPPAFDEVKERVRMLIQRKKLQGYLDQLRSTAKIEKSI